MKAIAGGEDEAQAIMKANLFRRKPEIAAKYQSDPGMKYMMDNPADSFIPSMFNLKLGQDRILEVDKLAAMPRENRKKYFTAKGKVNTTQFFGKEKDLREYMLFSGVLKDLKSREFKDSLERLQKNAYPQSPIYGGGQSPDKIKDQLVVRDKLLKLEEMQDRGVGLPAEILDSIANMGKYAGEIYLMGGLRPTTQLGKVGVAGKMAVTNVGELLNLVTERMTPKGYLGDKGEFIQTEKGQSVAMALPKSLLEQTVTYWTEQQGESIFNRLKGMNTWLMKKMPKGIASTIMKSRRLTEPFYAAIRKGQLDGMLPEMAEEYINRVMIPVLRLDDQYRDKDQTYLKGVAKSLIPDPRELAVQVATFGLLPVAGHLTGLAARGRGEQVQAAPAQVPVPAGKPPQVTPTTMVTPKIEVPGIAPEARTTPIVPPSATQGVVNQAQAKPQAVAKPIETAVPVVGQTAEIGAIEPGAEAKLPEGYVLIDRQEQLGENWKQQFSPASEEWKYRYVVTNEKGIAVGRGSTAEQAIQRGTGKATIKDTRPDYLRRVEKGEGNLDDIQAVAGDILREKFGWPQRSAKSEAEYYEIDDDRRIRLARHDVVYPESDVDLVISVGPSQDADVIIPENATANEIRRLIEEGTVKFQPAPAAEAKQLNIGDEITIMQVPSVLANTKTIGGVKWDIFNGVKLKEKRAAVRTIDIDSGEVLQLKQFPDYDSAEAYYKTETAKAERMEQPAEAQQAERQTLPSEKPQESAVRTILEKEGQYRFPNGDRYEVAETEFGWTAKITEGKTTLTKGGGYPVRWSKDYAIDKAIEEMRGRIVLGMKGEQEEPTEAVPAPAKPEAKAPPKPQVHEKSIEAVSKAIEERDADTLINWLHSGNKNLRRMFTEKTGVILPATHKGMVETIREWAREKTVTEEKPPQPEKELDTGKAEKVESAVEKEEAHGPEAKQLTGVRVGDVEAGGEGVEAKPPEVVAGPAKPGATPRVPERGGEAGGRVPGESTSTGDRLSSSGGSSTEDVDTTARRGRRSRTPAHSAGLDYRITETDQIGKGGPKAKYHKNISVIKLLKQIEGENRKATAEEQAILVQYVGWGGMPQVFDQWKEDWRNEYKELKGLLTEEEYDAARASTPNAHYTSFDVIGSMWEGLEQLGFKGGRINEPSMGVGHFYGMIPDALAAKSQLYGVELDSITGRIAQQLYQSANIEIKGFEKVKYPDNFFDLFISNVPFGDYRVHDPDLKNVKFRIHDFFFAKAIQKTRPGGLIAFITSRFTMDKTNSAVRKYMAKQADFLGAVRLPKTAFKENASTEVVTDILVFQKRDPKKYYSGQAFENLGELPLGAEVFNVNEYFVAHPENILGDLSYTGSMYGGKELTVEPKANMDIRPKIKSILGGLQLPETLDARQKAANQERNSSDYIVPAPSHLKERAYTVKGPQLFQNVDGMLVPVKTTPLITARMKGMIEVRDVMRDLLHKQLDPASSEAIVEQARKKLDTVYTEFTKDYKALSDAANQRVFGEDPDLPMLLSLEEYDKAKKRLIGKAPIFTKRTQFPYKEITHVDTVEDGLKVSLNEKGGVDVAYIGELSDKSEQEVIETLAGRIFFDPAAVKYEPAELYLAGNVRKKLQDARDAYDQTKDPQFQQNIKALEKVQPPDLEPGDINVRLGASWIDPEIYRQFYTSLVGGGGSRINFNRIKSEGIWVISGKPSWSAAETNTWGTNRFGALELIKLTMNQKEPTVYDTDAEGNRRVNQEETIAAKTMQQKIKDEFKTWLWTDAARAKTLVRQYNDLFNTTIFPQWDGSHLKLPGKVDDSVLKMRPHQKNVIWRFLTNGNTLMAHEVGAGKTYAGVAMAMEARRLGIAKKPVIVVPNHLVTQWGNAWVKMYPSATLLVATEKDFTPKSRQTLMNRIATGDWDGVIVPMSSFERIPMTPERMSEFIHEQIHQLEMERSAAKSERTTDRTLVKELEKAKKRLEALLEQLEAKWKKDMGPYFDELGIDMLFVDEAHEYKNLFFRTQMTRVAGVQQAFVQKTFDMQLKAEYINKISGYRGLVFATGTPITNTMAELFTMQRYLQPQVLAEKDLESFDFWAQNFGDTVTGVEVAPDGSGFRMHTRFAKFVNLPELMNMFRMATDVKTKDELGLKLPKIKGGRAEVIVAPKTELLKAYVDTLVERMAAIRTGRVDPSVDNALKIVGDGRKAALDLRLVLDNAPDDPAGKVNLCVEKVYDIWEQTKTTRDTQIIWCDLSVPKKGEWSVYEDIRRKLIKKGVPVGEIAFIHDVTDKSKLDGFYRKVNEGQTRIVIASTQRLSTGANIQQRLVAAHHLDAPWRPADIEQRDGRIIRQGNRHDEVQLKRYVTEGSFDAYMWQTLETKAKFIAQAMSGKNSAREMEDIGELTLSYAEVKALASGNPRIMEAVKLESEVKQLQALQQAHKNQNYGLRMKAAELPAQIEGHKKAAEQYKADDAKYQTAKEKAGEDVDFEFDGVKYTKRKEAGDALFAKLDTLNKQSLREHHVGQAFGFNLKAIYEVAPLETGLFGQKWHIIIDGDIKQTRPIEDSPIGSVTRILNMFEQMETRAQNNEALAKQFTKQLEGVKEVVDKPFDKREELREKSERLRALQIELNTETKPAQAPPKEEPPEGKLPGGRQAGGTIILPDVAAELQTIGNKLYHNPAKFSIALSQMVKRNARRATNYMRLLGGSGKKLADNIDQITYRVTKNANNDLQDIRNIYKGLSKESRELLSKVINERRSPASVPIRLRVKAEALRAVLDRSMNEANALGMKRKVKGEKIPIGGSGKAYPQALNAKGVAFLEEAAAQGKASARVFAWAQNQVQAGKYEDVDEAITALNRFREQRMRGLNLYLEAERVELPDEYIEWDGLHVLPHLIERNWMTVEGVREWGDRFELARSRIERIKQDYGSDAAYRVKLFIETSFGIRSVASEAAREISRQIRGYQFVTKVGLSPITIARNMFDRIAKGFTISPMSTIKTFIKYPPFINQFIRSAQKHEDWLIRSGAIFGHGSLSEGYEAGSVLTELVTSPFSESERGNQVFIGMVQYDKFLKDLAALKGKKAVLGKLLNPISYIWGGGEAQVKHRISEAAGEKALAKALKGEELTQEEVEFMLHKAVRDKAFPMILSTKPIWYDNRPFIKALVQFKTWPVQQLNMIWRDVVKYTVKTGDPTRLLGFLVGTLIAGELYNILRDFLYDKKESILSQYLKDPKEREVAMAILNDLVDGGVVGMLADFSFGIYDWATGVSARTAKNVWETALHIKKKPSLTLQALERLAEKELTPYRQIKRLAEKIDRKYINPQNISKDYYDWRAEGWKWNNDKENPTATDKVKAYTDRVLMGTPDYGVGENTLAYELAARQVIAGDVDDAAKYLRTILADSKKNRKDTLAAIKQSKASRSPLGKVAIKDRSKFLNQYSPDRRNKANAIQNQYNRNYDTALMMAQGGTIRPTVAPAASQSSSPNYLEGLPTLEELLGK